MKDKEEIKMKEKILKLKKEKDAVILAHYYVPAEVQEIADYVGDSYQLAKIAKDLKESVICFCGVRFMAESAKILNPDKTVLIPVDYADCAMAHMIKPEKIMQMREKYPDLTVVTYINSTAETKKYSDVCVTSSNAIKIVEKIDSEHIFFVPDQNLGSFINEQLPGKNMMLNDGYCPVHHILSAEDVKAAKEAHPNAKVLAHPECRKEVLNLADYVGSTSGIIQYATTHSDKEYIIATEYGVEYELRVQNPDKTFYPLKSEMVCADMKLITLEAVKNCLENMSNQVEVDEETARLASIPLNKMLELAK